MGRDKQTKTKGVQLILMRTLRGSQKRCDFEKTETQEPPKPSTFLCCDGSSHEGNQMLFESLLRRETSSWDENKVNARGVQLILMRAPHDFQKNAIC